MSLPACGEPYPLFGGGEMGDSEEQTLLGGGSSSSSSSEELSSVRSITSTFLLLSFDDPSFCSHDSVRDVSTRNLETYTVLPEFNKGVDYRIWNMKTAYRCLHRWKMRTLLAPLSLTSWEPNFHLLWTGFHHSQNSCSRFPWTTCTNSKLFQYTKAMLHKQNTQALVLQQKKNNCIKSLNYFHFFKHHEVNWHRWILPESPALYCQYTAYIQTHFCSNLECVM